MSQHLIGRQIDGIWHTSIVCFGYEIYYGQGIFVTDRVGKTQYGQPVEVKDMGITEIPQEVFAISHSSLNLKDICRVYRQSSRHLYSR